MNPKHEDIYEDLDLDDFTDEDGREELVEFLVTGGVYGTSRDRTMSRVSEEGEGFGRG
jgi:hypothetical protein